MGEPEYARVGASSDSEASDSEPLTKQSSSQRRRRSRRSQGVARGAPSPKTNLRVLVLASIALAVALAALYAIAGPARTRIVYVHDGQEAKQESLVQQQVDEAVADDSAPLETEETEEAEKAEEAAAQAEGVMSEEELNMVVPDAMPDDSTVPASGEYMDSASSGERWENIPAVPLPELPSEPKAPQIGPQGTICSYLPYGRLNNQILEAKGGIMMALLLNRTFVLAREMTTLIDVDRLQAAFPGLVAKHDPALCAGKHNNVKLRLFCRVNLGCNLLDTRVQDKLRRWTRNDKVLGINGYILFRSALYAHGAPEYGLNLSPIFYRNLYPVAPVRDKATAFIEENFAGKEFAAVHLRSLEKSCTSRMKAMNAGIGLMLCNPRLDTFLEVMNDTVGHTEMPIFVLSDHQNMNALASYKDRGLLYKGPCDGTECALVDFEIASRANFFVGVVVSTAADTIANLRRYRRSRDVGHQYPSILSWSRDPEEKKWHGGHYLKSHRTMDRRLLGSIE